MSARVRNVGLTIKRDAELIGVINEIARLTDTNSTLDALRNLVSQQGKAYLQYLLGPVHNLETSSSSSCQTALDQLLLSINLTLPETKAKLVTWAFVQGWKQCGEAVIKSVKET